MDKIIQAICYEARRRPGDDLAENLGRVLFEIQIMVGEIVAHIHESEKVLKREQPLQKGDDDDT